MCLHVIVSWYIFILIHGALNRNFKPTEQHRFSALLAKTFMPVSNAHAPVDVSKQDYSVFLDLDSKCL